MSAESREGARWNKVGQDQDRGKERGGAAQARPGGADRQTQATVGAGQTIQALGARSPASLPELSHFQPPIPVFYLSPLRANRTPSFFDRLQLCTLASLCPPELRFLLC